MHCVLLLLLLLLLLVVGCRYKPVNGTLPDFEQDLASFLLLRGPYAWLGAYRLCAGCASQVFALSLFPPPPPPVAPAASPSQCGPPTKGGTH